MKNRPKIISNQGKTIAIIFTKNSGISTYELKTSEKLLGSIIL